MMIKSNGRYFDFNGIVPMERRAKLFENIDETLGDFSYRFELPKTGNNMSILGFPSPDSVKSIYKFVPSQLVNDNGIAVYTGVLKVEDIDGPVINCSFFSGNTNWISIISGPLSGPASGIDYSDLNTVLTEDNIANSWDNEDGIIMPLFDTGALITRSANSLIIEDFSACIFVKTVFKKIFQSVGIKLQGDLFSDPVFNNLLLSRSTISKDEIDARFSFVYKAAGQSFSTLSSTTVKITFTDDTTYPYTDGSQDNFDTSLSRYTADVRMNVIYNPTFLYSHSGSAGGFANLIIRKNGSDFITVAMEQNVTDVTKSFTFSILLDPGEYLETFISIGAVPGASMTVNIGSTLNVTPTFVFYVAGDSLVPRSWTKEQFISNILSIFCAICDYEPIEKMLTINFFEGIKNKPAIDISDHIQITGTDYQEFVSNFAQNNFLKYSETDIDEIKEYNIKEFVSYGSGVIVVDNDFIGRSKDIVDSDFRSPISYYNDALTASIERVNFISLDANGEQDIISVSDSLGDARINVADDTIFRVGSVVRITDTINGVYNGDYVVKSTGAGTGFITVLGLFFSVTSTGKATSMLHRPTNDDSVYLFINVSYDIANVSRYSKNTYYTINENLFPNVGYAFFNLLNIGVPINDDYNQSLSFGSVNDTLSYQRTLIDKYWNVVSRVLNDPTKIKGIAYFNDELFKRLTPLNPVRIRAIDTDNIYYVNLISGYSESSMPCTIELIKLP